jgi:hypothetical protein
MVQHNLIASICLTFVSSFVFAAQGLSLETYIVNSADDMAGCFQLKPYKLKEKNETSTATHYITDFDIQKGCALKGLELARKKSTDKVTLIKLGEEVRKGFRQEGALGIYQILVENDKSKESCGDAQIYSAMTAGLAHPKDYPSAADSDVKKALAIVTACLESKQFSLDIKEEVATKKDYISENLCPFLKSKKVVSECP